MQPACPIGNTRTAWSVKEKEFFENYLKEVEVPSGGANSFWNNFAILLNKHCGTARTGQMCRSRYTRVRSLFGETKSETVSYQSGTHVSVETQTEPVIPLLQKRSYTCTVPLYDSNDICLPEGVDSGTQAVLSKIKETFQVPQASGSPESLSALLTAVISGDLDAISKAVFQHTDLRSLMEKLFQQEIQTQVSTKCRRSPDSCLFPKDYSALLNFSVGDVVEEFSRTVPFLFQCLLSVVVSNSMLFRVTLNKIQCIVPKLAMVYSILMSLRFHKLSQMKD